MSSVVNETPDTSGPFGGPADAAHPFDSLVNDDHEVTLLRGKGALEGAIDVLNTEGDRMFIIPSAVVDALRDAAEVGGTRKLLNFILEVHVRAWSRGFDVGVRCGKEQTLDRVHELLGVQKIADAIREAAHGK